MNGKDSLLAKHIMKFQNSKNKDKALKAPWKICRKSENKVGNRIPNIKKK